MMTDENLSLWEVLDTVLSHLKATWNHAKTILHVCLNVFISGHFLVQTRICHRLFQNKAKPCVMVGAQKG